MEVKPIRLNKAQFFPSCGRVNTTIWMHHMKTDTAYREKARQQLHKNATSYTEEILEVISNKTADVGPLTSHLNNHTNKTNKTCRTLLEKKGWTHKWLSSMDHFRRTSRCWTTSQNLQQLWTDTECSLEDQLRAMDDRDKWRKSRTYVIVEWHDDIYIYIYIYIYVCVCVCELNLRDPWWLRELGQKIWNNYFTT